MVHDIEMNSTNEIEEHSTEEATWAEVSYRVKAENPVDQPAPTKHLKCVMVTGGGESNEDEK